MDTQVNARIAAPGLGAPQTQPVTVTAGYVGSPGANQGQTSHRLVIEKDQATGSYVYKTVDRETGEVLQQYPRAEVLRMREAAFYAAGAVIDTTA